MYMYVGVGVGRLHVRWDRTGLKSSTVLQLYLELGSEPSTVLILYLKFTL